MTALAANAPSRAHVLAQWTRALSLLLFLSSAAAMIVALGSEPALMRWFGGDVTLLILALGFGLGCLAGGLLAWPGRSPLSLFVMLATVNGACGYISLTNGQTSPALA